MASTTIKSDVKCSIQTLITIDESLQQLIYTDVQELSKYLEQTATKLKQEETKLKEGLAEDIRKGCEEEMGRLNGLVN